MENSFIKSNVKLGANWDNLSLRCVEKAIGLEGMKEPRFTSKLLSLYSNREDVAQTRSNAELRNSPNENIYEPKVHEDGRDIPFHDDTSSKTGSARP